MGTRQTAGLLGGDLGSLCSGGSTGDSEPAPTPQFQLSYLEPQAALPSLSIKADALHSQNLASVSFWLGASLPALLTGPYKAEEMKVCEVSRLDESRPNKAEPSQSVLGEEGLEGGRRNLAFGLHCVRIF